MVQIPKCGVVPDTKVVTYIAGRNVLGLLRNF
jgi:hypothetical protein